MAVNTEPVWYQQWLEANNQTLNKPILSINHQENTITLCAGTTEMLRITDSGFYVRGIRVPVDDQECVKVYNAFTQWLNWNILNRNN